MARFCKFSLFFLLSLLLFSCQEGGDAGDMHGQWSLNGSDTKYIAFSGSITLIRDIESGEVYGNFQHVGDSLFIQCISIYAQASDTTIIEEGFGFKPFTDIRLRIEKLDSDNLIISKGSQKWTFYKY